MAEATKRCPFCGEEILAVAKKCKHCQSDLSANEKLSYADQKAKNDLWARKIATWFVILFIAGVWATIHFSDSSDAPSASPKPEPWSPSIGRHAMVTATGTSCPSKEGINAMEKAIAANDTQGYTEVLMRYDCHDLDKGKTVLVIDMNVPSSEDVGYKNAGIVNVRVRKDKDDGEAVWVPLSMLGAPPAFIP